ncbi:hypothetical protein NESM_000389800 [Novymonas esmeraldas]|uniref:Uncharacterized protein n=1 Tax=Novymonas esmeraldas TaxID=1808958 RepID=A0AAW0EMY5_9TRYP
MSGGAVGGDLARYTGAVLHSGEDDADVLDDAPQARLKLLSDFPEPLTELQRRAVQRHVSRQVREYEQVRQQVAVVERGYLALLRLVKRLRREAEDVKASLAEASETAGSTPAPVDAAPSAAVATESPSGTAGHAASPAASSATKESVAGPKRRLGGALLRSSVFSGLQRVLQAAKTEQADEKVEQLARQRERIARESRLRLVSEDLAVQEALLEPLQSKHARAASLGTAAAQAAAPWLTLLEDMWRLEAVYPARFSLLARGALEPLMGGSSAVGNDAEEQEAEGVAVGAREAATPAAGFAIPFTPAQYTADLEDVVRAQVEEVIDEYLAYRTRMDPVLYELEHAQQLAKAKKVDQLMDIIGIAGAEAGAEVLPFGGAAGMLREVRPAMAGKAAAQQVRNISSEDDDDDDHHVVAGATLREDGVDADQQDREQIRTALTALDDFEDA